MTKFDELGAKHTDIMIGGCTCMTKSPDTDYHHQTCKYRLAVESSLLLSDIRVEHRLTKQQLTALVFAVQDAWPYVHQWCTIQSIRDRLTALLQQYGDFADLHKSRMVGDVVVTTNEAGQCVAVTRQDDDGRIRSILWEAPPSTTDRVVIYGFDESVLLTLGNRPQIQRYGVYEPTQRMWWCRIATRPTLDLFEFPYPLASRRPVEFASCVVAIGGNNEKAVLKNRYTPPPTLPPMMPTFTFKWETRYDSV